MRKISKIIVLITFCITYMSGCNLNHLWDKDHLFEVTVPEDGLFVHDCSSYTQWHFFSFAEGKIIGSCDARDSLSNEAWRKRIDWDLAFHRQNVKSNGGISGVGLGGILEYKQDRFNFNAILEAPESGYQTDIADSVVYDMSGMMEGKIGYAYTGVCQVTKDWAVLTDMMNGVWTIAQKAFIVRTGDGKYAKIFLKKFKSDTGVSGTITMQYVYQADGSVNLDINQNSK